LPRAINLALLRLLQAMRQRQWARAQALAAQIIGREALPEVVAIHQGLGSRVGTANDD
jgi:hypothetical protein